MTIENVGTQAEGDIWLRLTIFSGVPAAPLTVTLPDERLEPFGIPGPKESTNRNQMLSGKMRQFRRANYNRLIAIAAEHA